MKIGTINKNEKYDNFLSGNNKINFKTKDIKEDPEQGDKITISTEGILKLEESNKKIEDFTQLKEMLDELNKSKNDKDDKFDTISKCIRIAMRIMDGDRVPAEDEKFLMENNPKLYTVAINMIKNKKDPKEWDSVLEEKEMPVDEIETPQIEIEMVQGGE